MTTEIRPGKLDSMMFANYGAARPRQGTTFACPPGYRPYAGRCVPSTPPPLPMPMMPPGAARPYPAMLGQQQMTRSPGGPGPGLPIPQPNPPRVGWWRVPSALTPQAIAFASSLFAALPPSLRYEWFRRFWASIGNPPGARP